MALLGTIGLAACGDPNFLNPPNFENTVTSVRIWAVHGTPIHLPSAWYTPAASRVRIDQTASFDFAFDITEDGQPVLLPQGTFGLLERIGNPGLQSTTRAWEDIKLAVLNGYRVADTLPIAVGDRFYARSEFATMCGASTPLYAKLQIMEVDYEERSVLFRILLNANCGYKSLEEGLPTR